MEGHYEEMIVCSKRSGVLDAFDEVFQIRKGLPSDHGRKHGIVLKDIKEPLNIRPY